MDPSEIERTYKNLKQQIQFREFGQNDFFLNDELRAVSTLYIQSRL